jgi:AraC-like DNA-binding protein
MAASNKIYVNTIAEFHRLSNRPEPEHPLLSITKCEESNWKPENGMTSLIRNFYTISFKKNVNAKFWYGQQEIDFNKGVLHFMLPKQSISIDASIERLNHSGWVLLIHPDFLWNTPLAKKIKQYEYFNYNVNEALHVSAKEEAIILKVFESISQEYHSGIDVHSQDIILAQIELILAYSERFYQRQFITRKKDNHRILQLLESLINEYFKDNDLVLKGMPTVQFIADELHISSNYLSRLLRAVTGQTTQQFLQDKLMDFAKEKLSTTDLSVSEIAYELGFKHSQSFNKIFKTKTNQTPLAFRQSFNSRS